MKRKTKKREGMVPFRPIITAGKGVNLHNVYRLRFSFLYLFLIKNFFSFYINKAEKKTRKKKETKLQSRSPSTVPSADRGDIKLYSAVKNICISFIYRYSHNQGTKIYK